MHSLLAFAVALALLALAACDPEPPEEVASPDARGPSYATDAAPPPEDVTYTVRGRVLPAFEEDPLPPTRVEVFDAWESGSDPFPAGAALLAEPPIAGDDSFEAAVTEDERGLVAGVVIDEASRLPDLLVATINEQPVIDGVAQVDAFVVPRTRLEAWQASPALAGHDLLAEGVVLVTFLDRTGRPDAGVHPVAPVAPLSSERGPVWFLSDDGWSILPGATATGASGKALVLGSTLLFALDRPEDDPRAETLHDPVIVGGRPGAIALRTLSPSTSGLLAQPLRSGCPDQGGQACSYPWP